MTAMPAGAVRAPCRLSVAEGAIGEAMDPLAFLERHAGERMFYLERRSDSVAIAAVGEVPGTQVDDVRSVGASAVGALRVGGFAFDRSRRPSGPWAGFPTATWVVPRVALLVRDGRCRLRAAATDLEGGRRRAEAILDEVRTRMERPAPVAAHPSLGVYRVEALGSVEHWRAAVEATLADIEVGRLSKLVLARAVRIVADAPWQRLRVASRLRAAQPGATVFAISCGAKTLVGATPERLATLHDGCLTTAAVAGTAPPAPSGGAEDRCFLADAKERREHAVVVEEMRRSLTSLTTRLAVAAEPAVLSTPALRHLHTPMSARLGPDVGLADVCLELHPTPAVCGLPREAAKASVREREQTDRGWYAGGVGWLEEGRGEVVVPLRAALLDGATATLFAGAGIVEGSQWQAELEETRLKMRVMQAALLEV